MRVYIVLAMSLVFLGAISCGKPAGELSTQSSGPVIPVTGNGSFGVHCTKGIYQEPKPVKLELMDCPIALERAELLQPLRPLIVQADCKDKYVTVRTEDRSVEAPFWEAMPDRSFSLTFDGGTAVFKTDGSGGECALPTSLTLNGRFSCKDRDAVDIYMEADWKLGKTAPRTLPRPDPNPSTSPSPGPSPSSTPRSWWPLPWPLGDRYDVANQYRPCNLPPSCYLRALTIVKQCQ